MRAIIVERRLVENYRARTPLISTRESGVICTWSSGSSLSLSIEGRPDGSVAVVVG